METPNTWHHKPASNTKPSAHAYSNAFKGANLFLQLLCIAPLTWLSISGLAAFLQFQLLGIIYSGMIIAFAAGSQWILALKNHNIWLVKNSFLCILIPWAALAMKHSYHYEIENVWLTLSLELIYLLYIDWAWLRKHHEIWHLNARTLVTMLLLMVHSIIIYRNFDL